MKKTISKATSSVISYTHWAHQKDFLCFLYPPQSEHFIFIIILHCKIYLNILIRWILFFFSQDTILWRGWRKNKKKNINNLTTWKCLKKKRNMQNASKVLNHPQIWANFFFVNFFFNAEHSDWYHWNIENTIDKDKLWNELINQFIWNICARSQFIRQKQKRNHSQMTENFPMKR